MFQFPGSPPPGLCVRPGGAGPPSGGFAHSETRGSTGVCPSPRTIAACRVLRRRPVPRHPPCARDIFPRSRRGARHGIFSIRMNSALALVYGRLHAVRVSHTGPPRGGPRSNALAKMTSKTCWNRISSSLLHRWRIVSSGREPSGLRPSRAMRLSRYAGSNPGDRTPRGGRDGTRRAGSPGLARSE